MHRRGLRWHGRGGAPPHARQDVGDPPRRAGHLRRAAQPLRGHPLPLAGGEPRFGSRRTGGDGHLERRRDHGAAPPRRCPSRASSSTPSRSSPLRGPACWQTSWPLAGARPEPGAAPRASPGLALARTSLGRRRLRRRGGGRRRRWCVVVVVVVVVAGLRHGHVDRAGGRLSTGPGRGVLTAAPCPPSPARGQSTGEQDGVRPGTAEWLAGGRAWVTPGTAARAGGRADETIRRHDAGPRILAPEARGGDVHGAPRWLRRIGDVWASPPVSCCRVCAGVGLKPTTLGTVT